jgi:hypothetical protein
MYQSLGMHRAYIVPQSREQLCRFAKRLNCQVMFPTQTSVEVQEQDSGEHYVIKWNDNNDGGINMIFLLPAHRVPKAAKE